MFFHLQVFLYSLLFAAGLKITTSQFAEELITRAVGDFPGVTFVVVLILMAYVFLVAKKIGRKYSMTPVPVLLALSSLVQIYFIDSQWQRNIFVFLAASIYYFLHLGIYRLRSYDKDQTARGLVASTSFATLFFCYAIIMGIYINFAVGLWVLMILFLISTVLVSAQYLYLVETDRTTAWKFSIVLGLAMVEISWILSFWPFGYLTTGVVALMVYYVFWDLAKVYFTGFLSKIRVIVNLAIVAVLMALVLGTSHWLPVV